MYGFLQARILENELLQRQLSLDGNQPTEHMNGLWKHETRPVYVLLVVDDFGIKYNGREKAEHLKASIEKNHEMSCDLTGSAYCGLKLDWDYSNKTADLSMPGYIKAALHIFKHPEPARPERAPHFFKSTSIWRKNTFFRGTRRQSSTFTKRCYSSSATWRQASLLRQSSRPNIGHVSQCPHLRSNKSHSSNSRSNHQVD
jgi:hypothetical protein